MNFDPAPLPFSTLFVDPHMFDSRHAWAESGFDVLNPAKDIECMAASHPAAPGYLFKKYKTRNRSSQEAQANYAARMEGAARLARFIEEKALRHVVVPKKYLHELPQQTFGKRNSILIVEKMDLVGQRESEKLFHDIADDVLRELITVLAKFRGLDSNAKNVQITRDGKIAFVDLENWQKKRDTWLKSIGSYLSTEKLHTAKKLIKELRR